MLGHMNGSATQTLSKGACEERQRPSDAPAWAARLSGNAPSGRQAPSVRQRLVWRLGLRRVCGLVFPRENSQKIRKNWANACRSITLPPPKTEHPREVLTRAFRLPRPDLP